MFLTCCLEMVVILKWVIEKPLRINKRIKKESFQVLFNPMPNNSHLFWVKITISCIFFIILNYTDIVIFWQIDSFIIILPGALTATSSIL